MKRTKRLHNIIILLAIALMMSMSFSVLASEKDDVSPNMIEAPAKEQEVTAKKLQDESQKQASGISVETHTAEEIREFINSRGLHSFETLTYDEVPDAWNAPYKLGKVSGKSLQLAIDTLNAVRYIAGIPYNVQLDENYTRYAQAAALVNNANNDLSHNPTKPEGMSDELFEWGRIGSGSSNLATGIDISLGGIIINGWMRDGDSSNIDRVGHRRCCLNPSMGKTGFGFAGRTSAMYVSDSSNDNPIQYKGMAWPAQNMPNTWFYKSDPWSISIGYSVLEENIRVELTRKRDSKKWVFSKEQSDGDFYVDNGYYGMTGCIIFRPEDIQDYYNGDVFEVNISGLPQPVSYQVNFFDVIPLEKISLNYSKLTLSENIGTKQLEVKCEPEGADRHSAEWTSSDPAVATVDEYGGVKAGKSGTATITVLMNGMQATCEIKVAPKPTKIWVNQRWVSVKIGESINLEVSVEPKGSNDSARWMIDSDSRDLISIDENGKVTGLKAGRALCWMFQADEHVSSDYCYITVTDSSSVPLESISLNKNQTNLTVGQTEDLTISYHPEDTTDDKDVTWSTSDDKVATVTDGTITAVFPGEADITARVGDKTAACTVTVTPGQIPLESISLDKTTMALKEGAEGTLSVTFNPDNTTADKTVSWTTSNGGVAAVTNGKVTAAAAGTATITATVGDKTAACTVTVTEEIKELAVSYQSHVQDFGWQDYVQNGATSGTISKGRRLEAIRIKLENNTIGGGIEYRTHVQDFGWQNYVKDGALSGTQGKGRQLEAIQIRLSGEMAEKYDVYYRTHIKDYGWLDWAKNDQMAGSSGLSKRMEAIEIQLLEKGGQAPGKTDRPYVTPKPVHVPQPSISYQTHVQDFGWQPVVKDGALSGTTGKARRLEGIKINVNGDGLKGGIEYSTHVENIGWQGYRADGALAGTTGKKLRLEAIKIHLTGELAEKYDVYYRTHIQDYGWLGWTKNDGKSGSEGLSKRLESIQIELVKKGGEAPEDSYLKPPYLTSK